MTKQAKKASQNFIVVKKSNDFINSKYRQTGFEGQLMAIALSRLKIVKGAPTASIVASELRELIGGDDSYIYKKLKRAATTMTGRQVIIEDGKGNFSAFSLITNADYIDHVFTITFNTMLTSHVTELSKNYTSYALANMLKLSNPYSQRIYEILKKESYLITRDHPVIKVAYDLAELKCMVGVVNMNEPKVQEAKRKGASWDEVVKIAKEKSFDRWSSFKSRILDRAHEDLKQTDIGFEYDVVRGNTGGNVIKVNFYISKTNSIPEELRHLVGHNKLTEMDILLLLSEAGNDSSKVLDSVAMADKAPNINNYMGWLLSCIKEDYSSTMVMEGSYERAEKVESIRNDYEAQKADENSPMYKSLWTKITNKDDFAAFMDYTELTIAMIEEFYSFKERVALFMEWKDGKKAV